MRCTGFFVTGNSSSTTFDFVLPPADYDDPMVPVGNVVDMDVGQVFPVGLSTLKMLSSRHTILLQAICATVAATFTVVPVPEIAVS